MKPFGWITEESRRRLFMMGGDCRATVPVHAAPSAVSTIAVYTEEGLVLPGEDFPTLGAVYRLQRLSGELARQAARAMERAMPVGCTIRFQKGRMRAPDEAEVVGYRRMGFDLKIVNTRTGAVRWINVADVIDVVRRSPAEAEGG